MAPLPPRIANLNRLPPSPPRNPFQSLNPAPHAEADLVLDAALARQLELWTNVDFTFDDGDMTHGGTFGSRAPTDASRMSPLKEEEDKEMGLEEIFQGKVKQRNMNRNLLMDEMEQREIANGTPQQEGPWWTGLPKNQQRNSAPPPQPIHNPPPSISLPAPIPSLPFPPDPNMQAQTVALANDPNFAAFVAAFSAAAALQQQQQNSTQTPTPQTAHASSSRLPSTRRESSSQPSSSKRPSVVIHQSAAPTPEEEDSPPGKKAKMMGPDGIMIDAVQVGDEIITIEEDKRRRNTAASARFRQKKKEREQALEKKSKEVEDRLQSLERENESLRRENGWLRSLLVTGIPQPLNSPRTEMMTVDSDGTGAIGVKRKRE